MDPGATPGDDLPSFLAGLEGAGSHDYEQPPAPDIRPAPPFCALMLARGRFLAAQAGGELQWHKTDVLGKIGYKLNQYSASTLHLSIKHS